MAIKCSELIEQIHDYLDGQLSESEAAAFENHLSSCDSCAAEYAFMKQMVSSLNDMREEEVPESLHHDIMTRVDELYTEKKAPRVIKIMRPITSVVAAAFLLFVVFSVLTTFNVLDTRLGLEKEVSNEVASDTSTHSLLDTAIKGDMDERNSNMGEASQDAGGMNEPEMFMMEDGMDFDEESVSLDASMTTMDTGDVAMEADFESMESLEMAEEDDYMSDDMASDNSQYIEDSLEESANTENPDVRKDQDLVQDDQVYEEDSLTANVTEEVLEKNESNVEEISENEAESRLENTRSGLDNISIIIPLGVSLMVAGVILFIYRKHR